MYFTGIADEAGAELDVQLKATKELGWKFIESRKIGSSSIAFMDDREFYNVCEKLDKAKIKINCFASGIANWSKPITEAPDSSYDEMKKAIPRMHTLGIKHIRIMSFNVPKELREKDFTKEVIKRVKTLVKMAEDGGVICLHENCMNWGGLSYEHTLKLLDGIKSPAFKLVFDIGNPVFNDDVRGNAPYKKQSAWEFYSAVKGHIAHIHVKDGRVENGKDIFTFPGEGDADVKKIVKDLLDNGYDAGFSIEPHMVTVFHDATAGKSNADECYKNYIEYGKRFMKIVESCKK